MLRLYTIKSFKPRFLFSFISLPFQMASSYSHHSTPESRLLGLGFDLAQRLPSAPKGSYAPCVRTGSLLFLAGHLPYDLQGQLVIGKIGQQYTAEEGMTFAKWTILGCLKTVQAELGSLSNVKRIVKLNGYLNTTDEFEAHSKVMNGASDVLLQVFGSNVGVHARTAVGCISLPLNVPIEIEMIVEI